VASSPAASAKRFRYSEPYTETVFHLYDKQARQRAEMRLRKQAARLGFQLLPIPETGE